MFLLFPSIASIHRPDDADANVFGQVRGAFNLLIDSWTTLVRVICIVRTSRSFEHELDRNKFRK
ncbi:SbmA/BacA-like family transporter [Shigella flexneri]